MAGDFQIPYPPRTEHERICRSTAVIQAAKDHLAHPNPITADALQIAIDAYDELTKTVTQHGCQHGCQCVADCIGDGCQTYDTGVKP